MQNMTCRLTQASLICACILAMPTAGMAQEAMPSADSILARYETFLGGAQALSHVSTRKTEMRRIEMSATPSDEVLTRASARPMLSIMRHEALDGSFIRYMNGCDAAGGWVGYGKGDSGDPKPGEASTDGVCEQEQYYYEYLPLDLARLKSNIKGFEVRARVQIVLADVGGWGAMAGGRGRDLVPAGPRQTYLVLTTPARSGDPFVWLYFDTQTGALLRRAEAGKGVAPIQPGVTPRYTDFLQYRNIGDGTKAPFQFVTVAPNSQVRGISTRITDNIKIDPTDLSRPKDVRRPDKGF